MIYRLICWLQSFFNLNIRCQLCTEKDKYSNTSIIKLKSANGAINDLVICKKCGDTLESMRINK